MGLLDELKASRPMSDTFPVEAWGGRDITIHRLQSGDKIKIIGIYNDAEKDDSGKMTDAAEQMEFAVELAAMSIVNSELVREFDSVEGRDFLRCEVEALADITPRAMMLNQLSSDIDEQVEAAKKN